MDDLRRVLEDVARRRATITYDELRAAVPGLERDELAGVLRSVSIASDDQGRGLLTALVVGPSGRPGNGWFRLAEERGRDASDPAAMWRRELEVVYSAGAGAE